MASLAALLALVLLGLCLQLFIFQAPFPPIGLVLAAGSLVMAVLVATGWRWAPAVGAAWCGLMLAGNAPAIVRDLSNPDDTANFVFNLWALPVLAIGIAAGVGAAIHNIRPIQANRPATGWLPLTVALLVGTSLGASLVALMPRPAAADVSLEATLPALAARGMTFDRPELHVHRGETLAVQLANHDGLEHSFDVDALNVHTYLPAGNARVTIFSATTPGTYPFYCGIPGHRDQMHGVLVVEP